MTIKPNPTLEYYRPDEIAECFDGVSDDLYQVLWNSIDDMQPMSDFIDIEDSCPQDAIGINSVVSIWDQFTEDEQRQLNQIVQRS